MKNVGNYNFHNIRKLEFPTFFMVSPICYDNVLSFDRDVPYLTNTQETFLLVNSSGKRLFTSGKALHVDTKFYC